jgi:LysR family transcriptional regulator, nitrogen assimilation regulatory protein
MPMSESLRSIQVFVATYEERSFTAAAKREHATQSGVSQHVRKLEGRLGAKLFSRDRGRVVPTPAGDAYYERSVELLRLASAASSAVSRFRGSLTGELVAGLMPTMTRSALAPALSRFTDEQPNVVISVVEAYSAVLTQQVRAGELDFAVVPAIPNTPGIRSSHFLRTIELLVSRPESHLRHLDPVRLRDLGSLRLVVPGPQNTRRRSIETYLAANGLECERVLELDAMLGTLDLVARSDWVTILPGIMMAADIERPLVTINPIVDPVFTLDLVLIEPSRRVMSPAAQLFVEMLQVESARLEEPWAPYLARKEGKRQIPAALPG